MPNPPELNILTVSQFTRDVKYVLESNFPAVWVSGEISNLAMPRSGHWYFTLKDEQSQVRCAMFRQHNRKVHFLPQEGSQILVNARVSLYEARGDFQLIVEQMEDAGEGALKRAYEQLKQKLYARGLFAEEYKLSLPEYPRRIAIITSPTGAALQDMLNVLQRRFPALPVIIYPSQVQGEAAAGQLIKALQRVQQQALCEVVILGRGGGSIEDLWAFNNEQLAQAIFDCTIPVISAVGHEIDFTICDFVADVRAATPSAAAELVSPDQNEWLSWLQGMEAKLQNLIQQRINLCRQQFDGLQKRLKHPGRYLEEVSQRIDELSLRMEQQLGLRLRLRQEKLLTLSARLKQHSPEYKLHNQLERLDYLQQRLQQSLTIKLKRDEQKLASLARQLDAFSPLATLGRGYCLVKNRQEQLIKTSRQLSPGDQVKICFAHDHAIARIEKLADSSCDSAKTELFNKKSLQ